MISLNITEVSQFDEGLRLSAPPLDQDVICSVSLGDGCLLPGCDHAGPEHLPAGLGDHRPVINTEPKEYFNISRNTCMEKVSAPHVGGEELGVPFAAHDLHHLLQSLIGNN